MTLDNNQIAAIIYYIAALPEDYRLQVRKDNEHLREELPREYQEVFDYFHGDKQRQNLSDEARFILTQLEYMIVREDEREHNPPYSEYSMV